MGRWRDEWKVIFVLLNRDNQLCVDERSGRSRHTLITDVPSLSPSLPALAATTLTEASNLWKPSASSSPTKSNSPKTSSSSGGTMSVLLSIEFTGFTTSASAAITSSCGRYVRCPPSSLPPYWPICLFAPRHRISNLRPSLSPSLPPSLPQTFTDCFNCLPVAAVIDEKIFCMHGGLSPDLNSLEEIKDIMRPTDVPETGLLCDLLWADPDKDIMGWGDNDRGVCYTFGEDVVAGFLKQHGLDLICRVGRIR